MNKAKKVMRVINEKKGKGEGFCPKCSSDNLDYGDISFSKGKLSQEIDCMDCDFAGYELFKTQYVETGAR